MYTRVTLSLDLEHSYKNKRCVYWKQEFPPKTDLKDRFETHPPHTLISTCLNFDRTENVFVLVS